MGRTIVLDDQTHKRLTSILNEIATARRHDIDYNDVIDQLIDTYQDSIAFSGENAGG